MVLRGVVTGAQIAADRQVQVKAGQFLISRIDARHGAFGIVPPELDGALVSGDFPCFDLDRSLIVPRYFEWYAKTDGFVDLCRRASEGSTNRVRLKEANFLRLTISLPSLDEQVRIGAMLDRVATLAEERRHLRKKIAAEVNPLTLSAHDAYAEPGCTVLGEFIELAEDRTLVDALCSYPQVGIRGFAGGLFFKEAVLGSETRYKAFNRLAPSLLVVSQPKGWEGAVAVCGPSHDGWFASPEYRTFRCKEGKLEPAYLAALLPTAWFQNELSKLTRGQGARRELLRPEMLLGMSIRMPSIERQRHALKAIERLRCIPATQEDFLASVDALMPALLNRIFNSGGERDFTSMDQDEERLILRDFGRHAHQVPARRFA